MRQKFTFTIAIPAHNEERSIGILLEDIKNQTLQGITLDKVLLIADNCKDNTISNAKNVRLSKLEIIEFKERKGKAHGLEHIMKHTDTDAIILLDADVRLKNANVLQKVLQPIINGKADLVSAKVKAEKSKKFIPSILYTSNEYKHTIYESWNKGNNIYTCHGRVIAASKKLYKQIKYKGIIADDALAYLTAKQMGLTYHYVNNASVHYKLPETLNDHKKQSSRFMQSQKQLEKIFNPDFIKKEYSIPPSLLIKKTIAFFFKRHIYMILYIAIFAYMKLINIKQSKHLTIWDIANTSKL